MGVMGSCPASLQPGAAHPAGPLCSLKAAHDHPDMFRSRGAHSPSAVSWEPQGTHQHPPSSVHGKGTDSFVFFSLFRVSAFSCTRARFQKC